MKNKYNVLFCDDEEAQRQKFLISHNGSAFHITTEANIDILPSNLSTMESLPDLLVLDLFHPRPSADPVKAKRLNDECNKTVEEIKTLLAKARGQIDPLFAPRAIDMVREIRKYDRLKNLPILLYTRYGIVTVNDDEMREAISEDASWMLKGRAPEVEQRMMSAAILKSKKRQSISEPTKTALWSSIFSALLGAVLGVVFTKFFS